MSKKKLKKKNHFLLKDNIFFSTLYMFVNFLFMVLKSESNPNVPVILYLFLNLTKFLKLNYYIISFNQLKLRFINTIFL